MGRGVVFKYFDCMDFSGLTPPASFSNGPSLIVIHLINTLINSDSSI